MSEREPRGRTKKESGPRMVFGIDQICWVCKGKGHPPYKKELCGQCGGSGVYRKEKPSE